MKNIMMAAVGLVYLLFFSGYVVAAKNSSEDKAVTDNSFSNYQEFYFSPKVIEQFKQKKVDKITAIVAKDEAGKDVIIDLTALHELPNPPEQDRKRPSGGCPPLYPGEPTSCLSIGWKNAGSEGGKNLPYHCHCYQ